MPQPTTLDALIRLVEANEMPQEAKQVRMIYLLSQQKAVVTVPFLYWGGSQSWLVTRDTEVKWGSAPIQMVSTASKEDTLSLRGQCILMCPQGNEARVVEALAGAAPEGPDRRLDRFFEQALREKKESLERESRDPVQNVLDQRAAWEQHLASRLQQLTGLQTTVSLELDDERTQQLELKEDYFAVYVQDYEDDLFLAFRLILTPKKERGDNVPLLAGKLDQFRKEVKRVLTECVNRHKLQQFCLEFDNSVRKDVDQEVKQLADRYHRDVLNLKLERKFHFEIPTLDAVRHEHSCTIRGCQRPIVIKHDALLQLTDLARFLRSGVKDVVAWLKGKVEDETQLALFNLDYQKVVMTFDHEIRAQIREKIETAASQIGFHVAHYGSISNLPHLDFIRDGFRKEFEEDFPTRDWNAPVRLNLVCSGKAEMDQLPLLEKFLDPNVSDLFETVIRPVIKEAAAGVLIETRIETFYQRFEGNLTVSTEESVEHRIRQAVQEQLRERLGIDGNATVRQTNTGLNERYLGLMSQKEELRKLRHLEFQIQPRGGFPLFFTLHYEIKGIAEKHWSVFQRNDYGGSVAKELQELSELIQSRIEEMMSDKIPREALDSRDPLQHERLKQTVLKGLEHFRGIEDHVRELRGLVIEVTHFDYQDPRQREAIAKISDQDRRSRDYQLENVQILRSRVLELKRSGEAADSPDLIDAERQLKSAEAALAELHGAARGPVEDPFQIPKSLPEQNPFVAIRLETARPRALEMRPSEPPAPPDSSSNDLSPKP